MTNLGYDPESRGQVFKAKDALKTPIDFRAKQGIGKKHVFVVHFVTICYMGLCLYVSGETGQRSTATL